jgi:hypothetical protein
MGLGVGGALAIGAGVSAAASLGGSILQSNAASSAADKANKTQRDALAQARSDVAPWTTAGEGALTGVQDAAGLNGQPGYDAAMAGFHTSPGYQFQLDQGLRAVDAGAAASGMLRSGATLKAEQAYGAGLADKEFTDYYNRLFDLSKLGEGAASGSAAASQATGTGMAQTDLSLGSAEASAYANAAKGIGNAANNYANNRLYNDRYASLAGGNGGYVPGQSWASLNTANPTVAPNTWSSQPDSYFLPGGAGYQI